MLTTKKRLFTTAIVWMLLQSGGLYAAKSVKEGAVDVRILVDVSGSMKKNDPHHLRVPAIKLISGILPENAISGIWMFAEDQEPLQAVGKVSKSWKKNVRSHAHKINDRGLFTNIGGALEKASEGWQKPQKQNKRMIVLLTDGKVDISKDLAVNEAERQRINDDVIPKLKQLGVRVYTIALSDDADKTLLAQISNSTDAWFESVKNADELEKVFLKIFEQSVNVPEVPITNNTFQIDHSVNEFTALIFKKQGEAIFLTSPSGERYESETMESSIIWYSENKFDLITITEPEAGKWKITGPVDKDNRVMVVSNLKLDVNNEELPANLIFGDELDIKVSLKEKGQVIKRPTFLSLVNFVGKITSTNIDQDLILQDDGMVDDKVKEDGIFEFKFKAPKIDDEVSFDIRVTSPTFERLYHRSIRVYSSYVNLSHKIADKTHPDHEIIVSPVKNLVNEKTFKVSGKLNTPLGINVDLIFKKNKQGQWVSKIKPNEIGGKYKATLTIEGESLAGKPFQLKDQKIDFEVPRKVASEDKTKQAPKKEQMATEDKPATSNDTDEKAKSEPKQESKDKSKPTSEDDKSKQDKKPEPEADNAKTGLSTFWWIIIGVAFNLIFFGGGFLLWKRWKKKQNSEDQDLANALEDDDSDTPQGEKA